MSIVNAHTHLELGWAHYLCPRPPGEPFHVWFEKLVKLNGEARASGKREGLQQRAIETGIQQLLDSGTTHVGDICNSGLSIEPLFASGLSGVVYIEVIGAVREVAMFMFERAKGFVEEFRPKQPHSFRIGITAHSPYTTHPDAIRACADYCQRERIPFCMHVAESPGEIEELMHGRGPLYDIPKRLGFETEHFVPGTTPIRYLHQLGVLDAKPLLVHMVHVSDDEWDLVAASGSTVAHCPRSNALLQCGTMELDKALSRGISVALGTDSLASSPDLDIQRELQIAISAHQGYVAPESVAALLRNSTVF